MLQHADSVPLVPHLARSVRAMNGGGIRHAVACGGYACAVDLMLELRGIPLERKRYADDHEERTC